MLSRWPWSSSAASKKRAHEHEFASQAFVLVLLIGGVAVVFWQQLVGAAVFIGESDRLNTYLNMRLAEYDALRTYGRAPAWNPTMFGGFSVAALHWMNPGTDPIAFFLQLFPRDRVYQALGYVSIALVLAACTTAYFYIRDLTGVRIPAAIAALCYGLSVFGIHRIAQVDNAYLTLVLLPAAMLATRALITAVGLIFVAALLSWVIHGPIFDQLLAKTTLRIRPPDIVLQHPPDLIVLPIAVKVALTTAILVAVLAGLLRRPTPAFDGRVAAMIVVATFAVVETEAYAHFKVNGSQNWTYPLPFGSLSYMDVPPSVMRPPGQDRLKAFADKAETEKFRSILVSEPSFYAGLFTSHVSQFWRGRIVGGYGTGVPERLAELPWPEGVRGLRTIELRRTSINPYLLALLNVKYLVFVTPDLYFNTASKDALTPTLGGAPTEVVNIDGISFGLIRNSVTPLPRHFLVEKVTGVQKTPRLQGDALEARARPASESQDGTHPSALVREQVNRLASQSLAEDFRGTGVFDASGSLDVAYRDDVIDVRVTPANRERFLVINERYHPNWRARAQAEDIPIYPTNIVMMGIRIPANVDRIELRFEPFSSTWAAYVLMLLAVLIFLAAIGAFWFAQRRVSRQPS